MPFRLPLSADIISAATPYDAAAAIAALRFSFRRFAAMRHAAARRYAIIFRQRADFIYADTPPLSAAMFYMPLLPPR
jgi:hypothetical protein